MKIIKKGKYTDKVYKCENCGCEMEIDYNDIICSEFYNILSNPKKREIKIYFLCPECKEKIIIEEYEKDKGDIR